MSVYSPYALALQPENLQQYNNELVYDGAIFWPAVQRSGQTPVPFDEELLKAYKFIKAFSYFACGHMKGLL